MSRSAVYDVVEERRIPLRGPVGGDEVGRLTGLRAGEECVHASRRIHMNDLTKDEALVFLITASSSGPRRCRRLI